MNLYLLRHGIATERTGQNGLDDADRALTAEGKQKLRQVARAMTRLELSFDLVISSPYRRARETAGVIVKCLRLPNPPEFSDALAPGGSLRKLTGLLRNRGNSLDSILLVGHEPDLSELISLLVFGKKAGGVVMKKGGLCKLSVLELRQSRCARLEWLLTPRLMQCMR
jgi:phosphohistidine phosphatase